MFQILVCEDHLEDIKHLSHLIHDAFTQENISYHLTILNEKSGLDFKKYDLIFLDIQLTSYNGIQLGHLIRRQCPKIPIIITSLYAEYLQQGYLIEAKRYLLKPISCLDFQRVFYDVILKDCKQQKALTDLKISPYKIYYKDVYYVEFYDRHTYLYLKHKKYRTTYSLSYWKERLTFYDFGQSYKAFLVSYRHIDDLSRDKKDILLTNGVSIPLSKKYKASFMKGYLHYLQCSQ